MRPPRPSPQLELDANRSVHKAFTDQLHSVGYTLFLIIPTQNSINPLNPVVMGSRGGQDNPSCQTILRLWFKNHPESGLHPCPTAKLQALITTACFPEQIALLGIDGCCSLLNKWPF